MSRLQFTPEMDGMLQEMRRRKQQEEQEAGPQRMRFFDQMTGMAPRSAPTEYGPPADTSERDEMIRGQIESRLGPQMAAGGPLGAMGGFMATGRAPSLPEPPIPAPSPISAPQLPPPPNAVLSDSGASPYLSSIVTGSGTRTMAYPQGPDGTFGRGQDLGMTPWEQQGSPADQLRNSFMANRYGNGTPSSFLPPALAAEMALGEMRNRTIQQEGELQRQNLMERERLEQEGRVRAAEANRRDVQSSAQYQAAVNSFLSGQGPQFAQADAFARSLGGQQPGSMLGGQVPMMPSGPGTIEPDAAAKVNRLLMQSTADLPKNFAYEIPGMGMGANRKPAMAIAGALDGKVTPDVADRLLGRFAAEGFGEKEFSALSEALGRSPGGQDLRKALIAKMMTDELAYRPPPVQGQSGLGGLLSAGMFGRTNVYPERMGYSDIFPGAQLTANPAETWVGAGLKSLKDRWYTGGLPYRAVNVGGESIPIDPGASQAALAAIFGGNEAIKRGIESRRNTYGPLYKALTGSTAR